MKPVISGLLACFLVSEVSGHGFFANNFFNRFRRPTLPFNKPTLPSVPINKPAVPIRKPPITFTKPIPLIKPPIPPRPILPFKKPILPIKKPILPRPVVPFKKPILPFKKPILPQPILPFKKPILPRPFLPTKPPISLRPIPLIKPPTLPIPKPVLPIKKPFPPIIKPILPIKPPIRPIKPIIKPILPIKPSIRPINPIIKPIIKLPIFYKCHWCGVNAVCGLNRCCRCPPHYVGNPYFLCYRPSASDVCQLCDDPVVTTENNENASLAYYSSTLMMDKTVSRVRCPGTCRVRVVVSNYRLQGKTYPRCVVVKIDLKHTRGQVTCSLAYKICGSSRLDGNLCWKVSSGFVGKDGHIVYTAWRTIHSSLPRACPRPPLLCRIPVFFQVSKAKMLIMRVATCSLTIGFRPFVKHIEWLKSGIFILTASSKPESSYPAPEKSSGICLRPGVTLEALETKLGLSYRRHALSYLALTNTPSDLLAVPPEQVALTNALSHCPAENLKRLFNDANFLLSSPLFVRDISGSKEGFSEIMKLAKKAADWFCDENTDSCHSMVDVIKDRAGELLDRKEFPKLVQFVKTNCTKT